MGLVVAGAGSVVTAQGTFFRSGTLFRRELVKTMIKKTTGKAVWEQDLYRRSVGGTFQFICSPINSQHSPETESTTSLLLWSGQSPQGSFKGPFLPLSTTTYLATFWAELSFPSCPLCPGLQIRDAAFHSLFNLSRKCLVTDPATWHPPSRCGSGMLTKKVIFQPS